MGTPASQPDPVKYEMFHHRLWAIGEEGRSSIQRVTASPIVSQGGECMASFYTAQGVMVLACSGHLRFAAATSDAIWQGIWYTGGPGHFYGGHNRERLVTAQGLYDGHGAGLGAAPTRDGVHCGGNMLLSPAKFS
ncbi:MAG: hypothetical protein ACE5JU_05355 [Candidatus Binatia bacterium]